MIKKKYHGGLKVFLSLLFIMLLGTFSTCYAVDYTDFDIPIEFWDSLVNYTNSNSNLCRYSDQIFTLTVSSTDLKNFYDTYVKTDLKNYITSIGGDDRNMIVVITYPSSSNKYITFYFCGATNGINNTDLTDFKMGLYLDQYYRMTSISSGSWYAMRINSSGVISNSNVPTPGNNIAWKYDTSQLDLSSSTLNNGPFFGVNNGPLNSIDFNNNILHVSGYYDINPIPIIPDEPSGDNSGDVPINPSGDNGGNGFIDYTNQLNTIRDTISGEAQAIRDNDDKNTDKIIGFLSSDSYSGDVSGEINSLVNMTANISDPTVNFFSWLIDNLRSVLNSSGNYDISIDFMGEIYVISSNFFVLPDGDFKTFLQLAFIAWFAWHIIKKIRYIVYAVKCVKLTDALHEVDFNPNIL